MDIAAKFGAASAPILAFFLWREVTRNDRLEAENRTLGGKVENMAERNLTAMLEVKHAMQTFGAVVGATKPPL